MNENFTNLDLSKRGRKHFFKKYKYLLLVVSILIILTIFWAFLTSTSSVFHFAIARVNPLKSTDERVNILMLGNAGGRHDGPYLTDSIIIASYHLKSKKTTLISVPRDLWLENTKTKVNTVYIYGQQKSQNGLKIAEDEIDNILGIPIHYGVRIDFRGFEKAIDIVEGIDVDVTKTFDDYNYPIEGKENDLCGLQEKEMELSSEQIAALNLKDDHLKLKPGLNKVLINTEGNIATDSGDFACRFEHISFKNGKTHMDGVTALKFVRSRMGTNGEGSDFARSARQQLVLQAFRSKVLSLETLFNPSKLKGLLDAFGESFETDIPIERSLDFYKLVRNSESVSNIVLGDLGGAKSILTVPPASQYGGAFVLIPPNNDFTPIKDYINQRLLEDSIKVEEE